MRKSFFTLLLLGWAILANGQIIPSVCTAPDSIVAQYRADAYRLALQKIYRRHLPERDSIRIPRAHADTVLRALVAVYNATTLPARDSVVNRYAIHSFPAPVLNSLMIAADSGHSWMQQLSAGNAPTGYAPLDNILAAYDLRRDYYYSFSSAFGYDVVTFTTDSSYNLPPLTQRFGAIPGVLYADLKSVIGDGNNITDSIYADHVELIYSYGFGDCPAGCTGRRFWKFKVYFDCSVEFVRGYGTPLPVTGVSEPIAREAAVYPVPFKDAISLSGIPAPFDFTLTTVLGQAVATGKALGNQTIGNLDHLQPGCYMLTISAGNRTRHYKVWKQ